MSLPGFDADNTIGALLIGGLVSAILYGITSTQSVVYYQRECGDWWLVRFTVLFLWILDTFDMCLIFHILYWYLIINYGDPAALANPIWSIILHVLVTSVTRTAVRGMFATRIWRLSQGNWLLVSVVGAVSFTDIAICFTITVKAFHTTFEELKKLDVLVYLEFGASLFGDTLVAVSLCYILHRSRTGFGRTETVITWLMTYIVNTGLFTAVTSSVSLVLFASQPNNYIYIAVYFQLSKLYVNAYLAMLNARDKMRSKSAEPLSLGSIHVSSTFSPSQDDIRAGPTLPLRGSHLHSVSKDDALSIFVRTEGDVRTERVRGKVDVTRTV